MLLNNTWFASFCVGYGIQTQTLQIYSPILVVQSAECHFLEKPKLCKKRKEQVVYVLRATSRRQSDFFVYQITLKGYRIPLSYHLLKCKNITKICNCHRGKNVKEKPGHHTSLSDNITLYNVCSVHPGVFSTSGGYHEYIRGYHEYIGGCSVHRRDTMSTSGVFSTSEGYHEYIGGIP